MATYVLIYDLCPKTTGGIEMKHEFPAEDDYRAKQGAKTFIAGSSRRPVRLLKVVADFEPSQQKDKNETLSKAA